MRGSALDVTPFLLHEPEICDGPAHPTAHNRPSISRIPGISDSGIGSDVVLRIASKAIALCDMRTLYLRNVPEDVVDRLGRLAARDGMSVAAVAVRELADVSRRADNPALLGALPDLDIPASELADDVGAGRDDR